MNVYSVRLIPSLKLKLCQFLGIASTMAVGELSQRLERMEQKLDRLDSQMRRSSRRQLVLSREELVEMKPAVKKKSSSPRPATASKPPKSKPRLAEVTPLARPEVPVELAVSVVAEETAAPIAFEAPVRRDSVVLIAAEAGTRRAVQDYFGTQVDVVEIDGIETLGDALQKGRTLSVIFERTLLAQDSVREILASLSRSYPETRWVGLSSYLTLAFAQSMPEREDFATFLTRPLSVEALAGLFSKGEAESAISASGRTDLA